ncbi:MAG TPA: LacI family DNA-binding transcriptional regulator, partial [Casimicrobiaceae bacterium]|nr:LacI family DNA-binding transcriptional regulator [Casimicrobiaceae bacterium]
MDEEALPTRRTVIATEPRAGSITSREVAKLAGVSQATVSRVLHAHPGVRPDVRERVQQVLAQTQYQPNAMARAMKTSRIGSVGVVVARSRTAGDWDRGR